MKLTIKGNKHHFVTFGDLAEVLEEVTEELEAQIKELRRELELERRLRLGAR